MENEILKLEKRVEELNFWKEARQKERLVYPIDGGDRDLIQKSALNMLIATGNVPIAVNGMQSDYLSYGLYIYTNGQKRVVFASYPLRQFTANAGTDYITNVNGSHNMKNGSTFAVETDDTLPGGLNAVTAYYVVNRTGTTFQASLTLGGSAIDITDSGIGQHFFAQLS